MSIGGLLLESGDGWSFSLRDGTIAGKLHDFPGVLRIAIVASNQVPQPCTHEWCLQLAKDWVGAARAKLVDVQLSESVTGPFGSASFRRGKDDVTLWYCTRAPGLILGAYGCPVPFGRTPDGRVVRARCGRMISSAVFDRTTWGAEDELTKLLVEQRASDEPKRPEPRRRAPVLPPPPAADTAPKAAAPKRRRP
jgi:hypothetical protein